jgi:hypothetical protein
MQNNNPNIPPHLMQQYQQQLMQQQQQQRIFHPQVAYPTMANNIRPSERTQGVFSTYASRLKHSDDNALLLPESYITKKTRFTGNESDDEFNELMEESDEEEEEEEGEEDEEGEQEVSKKQHPVKKEPAKIIPLPGSAVALPPPTNDQRLIKRKNHLFYSSMDLNNISEIDEILVPIRLDIDIESIKLRDRFLWNMNGK